MWVRKEKEGKIWYELSFDSDTRILQGTKSFNPLKEMDGNLCGLRQIHSSVIHRADFGVRLVGDGIFTEEKDVLIYVKTADCLPIILYHPEERILAILHAGWKGTLLRITRKFFLKMKNDFKLNVSDWIVAMGPSIDRKDYEVGTEVYELFKFEGLTGIHIEGNRYFLDLKEANKREMEEMGVTNFLTFPEDVYSSDIFYSYRRGDKERNITAGKIN